MDWKPIENSEFDDILDLLDASFPIRRELINRDLQEVIDDPRPHGKIYRLKVDGNQIVGTAIYGQIYRTPQSQSDSNARESQGILRYLAIHSDHRRKGYATWILNKVMSDLKDAGCPCLCISIWPDDDVCRSLSKRFGFEYFDTFINEDHGIPDDKHNIYVYWFPTDEKNEMQ